MLPFLLYVLLIHNAIPMEGNCIELAENIHAWSGKNIRIL